MNRLATRPKENSPVVHLSLIEAVESVSSITHKRSAANVCVGKPRLTSAGSEPICLLAEKKGKKVK